MPDATDSDTPVMDTLAAMTTASDSEPESQTAGSRAGTRRRARRHERSAGVLPPEHRSGRRHGAYPRGRQDVLVAVAPIVGTSRVVSAAGNIARALGLVIAGLADDED